MPYPDATPEQIGFFREHGYLVVGDAIPQADLDQLEGHCDTLIDEKERLANDWAWDAKESRDKRSFRIVQSSPALVWKDIGEQAYRHWLVSFASQLMGMELEFWYDQFLGKPPGKSVPTEWHQDEGYWGRNLADRGITGWIPLQDVDRVNGCMHFIDGGHVQGVLQHRLVKGMQSDLLICEVDETPHGRLPDAARRRGLPPFEDPAHEYRQYRHRLAQGGHQSPAGNRCRWRRRSLPVAGQGQPEDRHARGAREQAAGKDLRGAGRCGEGGRRLSPVIPPRRPA